LSNLDTGGLVAGTLDYSNPANAPSRTVYIARPDSTVAGGLKTVAGAYEADAAKTYLFTG
jgi:hypothetical protein